MQAMALGRPVRAFVLCSSLVMEVGEMGARRLSAVESSKAGEVDQQTQCQP